MKNNFQLVICIMLLLFMVFYSLDSYNNKRILTEIRDKYITTEEILLNRFDSVSNSLKQRQDKTDSIIIQTKTKETKIYNNYYEREQDYIHADTVNDSIIEYLSRRKFKRFTF